jgi:hypothetical protein
MMRTPVIAPTVIRWGAVTLLSLSSLAFAAGAALSSSSSPADAARAAARVDAPVPPVPPAAPAIAADLAEPAPPPALEPPALPGQPAPRPLAPMPPELPPFPGLMAGPFGFPSTAMAATDQYVYVLRGNTLYSFDARTLRQNASVTLEPPQARSQRPGPAPEALPGPAREPVAPAPPQRPDQPEALPARPEGGRVRAPDVFRGRAYAGPGALGRGFSGFRPFGGGEPGVFGRGFGADQPGRLFGAMGALPASPPSLTATDRYVYVLRGNTLYSFDARTLRQVGKTTLEPPRPRSDDRLPAPAPPAR